jgi:hypothetical protein
LNRQSNLRGAVYTVAAVTLSRSNSFTLPLTCEVHDAAQQPYHTASMQAPLEQAKAKQTCGPARTPNDHGR